MRTDERERSMTHMNDVVAKERIADLHRETATDRPARNARAVGPDRGALRAHTRRQGSVAYALIDHDMPLEEIRAVLRAKDPAIVARYMELHRERLAERLAQGVRELKALERIITGRLTVAAPKP